MPPKSKAKAGAANNNNNNKKRKANNNNYDDDSNDDCDFNPLDFDTTQNIKDDDVVEMDTSQAKYGNGDKYQRSEELVDAADIPNLQQDVRDLFRLAMQGDALGLEALFQRSQIHADTQDATGHTPLLVASRYGCIDAMRVLIKEGANPLHYTQNGNSAFMLAAAAGQLGSLRFLFEEVVPALLPSDLQILLINKNFDTVLMFALMAGQLKCVQYLIYLGLAAGVLGVENQHYLPPGKGNTLHTLGLEPTPPQQGNKKNKKDIYDDIDMWLHPLSLFYVNRDGLTPLMCACECENAEVVDLITKTLQFVTDGKGLDEITELFDPAALAVLEQDPSGLIEPQHDMDEDAEQQDKVDAEDKPLEFKLCDDELDRQWLFHHLLNIYLDDSTGDEYDEADVRAKYDTTQLPPPNSFNTQVAHLTKNLSKDKKLKFIKKYINHRDVNGNTALHVACRDLYLQPPQTAPINKFTGKRENMVQFLAQHKLAQINNELIATTLIQLGADCSICNHCYETSYELVVKHFASNTSLSYKAFIDQKLGLAVANGIGMGKKNHAIANNIDFTSEYTPQLLKLMKVRMDEKQKEADQSLLQLLSSKDKKGKKDNNNNKQQQQKGKAQQTQQKAKAQQPQQQKEEIAQPEIKTDTTLTPEDTQPDNIKSQNNNNNGDDDIAEDTIDLLQLVKKEEPNSKNQNENKKKDTKKQDTKTNNSINKNNIDSSVTSTTVTKESTVNNIITPLNTQPIEEDDGQGWVKARGSKKPNNNTNTNNNDNTKKVQSEQTTKQPLAKESAEVKKEAEKKPTVVKEKEPIQQQQQQNVIKPVEQQQATEQPQQSTTTQQQQEQSSSTVKGVWGKTSAVDVLAVQPAVSEQQQPPRVDMEISQLVLSASGHGTPQPLPRLNGTQHPRRLTQIIHEEYPMSQELALGAAHVLGQGLSTLSSEQLDCVYSILTSLGQRVQDEQRTRLEEENRELSNQLSEAEVNIAILQDKLMRYEQMMKLQQQNKQ